IWMGDFNRHSPAWDEPRNSHLFTNRNLAAADVLLNLASHFDMDMALPKHIPTLRAHATKNWTRVDNVWISSEMSNRIVECNTKPDQIPPK
ncbi:hypothetical protein OF83DRAFT_1044737, partial [Amylostereum chailletii]